MLTPPLSYREIYGRKADSPKRASLYQQPQKEKHFTSPASQSQHARFVAVLFQQYLRLNLE